MKSLKHILLSAVLAAGLSAPAMAEKAVAELYTSQGCNSCPPADAILSDLAKRPDVLALSFHVTYWDYLGWQDTFGREENTKRQRWYKKVLGAQVYTPQLVVNGTAQVVGNQRAAVSQAVKNTPALPVSIDIAKNGAGGLTVNLGGAGHSLNAAIFVVRYDSSQTVAIKRGENRGRTMTYSNVVRDMKDVGGYDGTATTIALPQIDMWAQGSDRCAILIQDKRSGRILGAQSVSLR